MSRKAWIVMAVCAGMCVAYMPAHEGLAATRPCLKVTDRDVICIGYTPLVCECRLLSGCTAANIVLISVKEVTTQSDYLAECETVPCATSQVCGPNPADPCHETFFGWFGSCTVFGDLMGHGTQTSCTQTTTPC